MIITEVNQVKDAVSSEEHLWVEAQIASFFTDAEAGDEDPFPCSDNFRFATALGHVTVRWLGVSNGYYSESVSYIEEPSS